ncbi:MAG: 30S ribosomal protein S9 [Myxococcales bacterium]|nr:30S ribosomal protein S9 [Myxococcales bacterium]USN51779.1 MAG: 30S ribosomal protein S9 [Myxococcales bacterium]
MNRFYATGRRKVSAARVWLKKGTGQIVVNGQTLAAYFKREVLQMIIKQPFEATETLGSYDAHITVSGGGLSGQAGAVRHGISRALQRDETQNLGPALKRGGFLTRDARMVERKKYGQPGARKRFQYSKR